MFGTPCLYGGMGAVGRLGRGLLAAAVLGAVLGGGLYAGRAPLAAAHVLVRGVAAGVYAAPEAGAEMVTEVIAGERLAVRRRSGDWLEVAVPDGYTGWVQARDVVPYRPGKGPLDGVRRKVLILAPVVEAAAGTGGATTLLTMGCELGLLETSAGRYRVKLPEGSGWVPAEAGRVLPVDARPPRGTRADVIRTAQRFLGTPYVWGGTTALGIDCSGFTYRVYQVNGIRLPRDADRQFDAPRARPVDKPAPGDLVFFSGSHAGLHGVSHVGIYLGAGEFIHASSGRGVVVNRLDDPYYRDHYLGARSFL